MVFVSNQPHHSVRHTRQIAAFVYQNKNINTHNDARTHGSSRDIVSPARKDTVVRIIFASSATSWSEGWMLCTYAIRGLSPFRA